MDKNYKKDSSVSSWLLVLSTVVTKLINSRFTYLLIYLLTYLLAVNARCHGVKTIQNVTAGLKRTLHERDNAAADYTTAASVHVTAATSTANTELEATKFINFRQKVFFSNFSTVSNFCYDFFCFS